MRRFLKEYFTLTKTERKGLILLLSILVLVVSVPYLYGWIFPQEPLQMEIVPLPEKAEGNQAFSHQQDSLVPFEFNPNTLDQEDFRQMGLADSLVESIINYREAGGQFYEKDDLLRIYSMDKATYLVLEPYINIPSDDGGFYKNDYEERTIDTVDINWSDSAAFEQLPGIGPYYSSRIVSYRDAVGGFDSITHIKEVYGIDDSLYSRVAGYLTFSPVDTAVAPAEKVTAAPPKKQEHNLNKVDSAQLTLTKGIGPWFAGSIIEYRERLGGFHSTDQLYEVYNLDSAVIARLKKDYVVEGTIRKININEASVDEMKVHPYISKAMAEFIVTYRIDHLRIKKLEELRSSYLVDEKLLRKIAPYIEL